MLYVTAEGIAILHAFAALLFPLPLGLILTSVFRVQRAPWVALLGTGAFAALIPAMIALAPGPSITSLPRALFGLPILVAGVVAYVIAGYVVTRVRWRWPVLCAALGVGVFVTMVLQSRTWIVNWHEERALAAVDIPLLGLQGQAPVWVEIEHDPNDTFVFLDFNSSAVALHPVSVGNPQAACEKPYPGEPPYPCRQLTSGQWIREHGLGGVVLFGVRHGVLVEINSPSQEQAVTTLGSLAPTTAAALAWSR
ncbi:hypothetical protein AB0B45_39245 [Nonomuraea sp. NPDC049152]|uniref:hypothetical protein n=1 Tax=Nonomuraea sp. NPDC049152 TaxID=3154350 RepID=UPI0033D1A9FD